MKRYLGLTIAALFVLTTSGAAAESHPLLGTWKKVASRQSDDSEWQDTFRTVLSPSEGALGRRRLDVPPEEAAVAQAIYAEQIHPIVVERSSAEALRATLGARYDANAGTAHYQALYDLTFVHDDDAYHVGYNCNHAVAAWLESVGCTVSGPRITADFTVRAVTEPTDARTSQ